jgi:hypothetical protein
MKKKTISRIKRCADIVCDSHDDRDSASTGSIRSSHQSQSSRAWDSRARQGRLYRSGLAHAATQEICGPVTEKLAPHLRCSAEQSSRQCLDVQPRLRYHHSQFARLSSICPLICRKDIRARANRSEVRSRPNLHPIVGLQSGVLTSNHRLQQKSVLKFSQPFRSCSPTFPASIKNDPIISSWKCAIWKHHSPQAIDLPIYFLSKCADMSINKKT